MNRLRLWCSLLFLLVVGCSGEGALTPAKSASHGGDAPRDALESAPGAPAGQPAADSRPAPSEPSPASATSPPPPIPPPTALLDRGPSSEKREIAEDEAPRSESTATPRQRERPGLGTEWGEERVSRVHDVAFVRADEDRPFAVASLNYNDRAGVDALVQTRAARGPILRQEDAAGGAISVAVHDGSGESLEAVHIGDRTFVIGQAGQRYTLVLTNHTGRRFEAVATVDGLDVVNGKSGGLKNRGYVLMPFSTLEIDGFRQSQSTVAAFRFSRVSDSYAAQVGQGRNVGVIGVAFFAERGDDAVWTRDELERRDTANPFPASDPRFAKPPRR